MPPDPRSAELARAPDRSTHEDPAPTAELLAVAEYGPAPAHLIACVPYALLVLVRQRALRIAMRDLERLRQRAEEDARRALAALGRSVVTSDTDDPELAELVRAAVAEADAATRSADERRAFEDAHARQRAQLHESLRDAEQAAAPFRDRESTLVARAAVHETEARRADARAARVEIELRNARATEPAREPALATELDTRRAEARLARGQLTSVEHELADVRRELARCLTAVEEVRTQLRALAAADERAARARESADTTAARLVTEAFAQVGRAALRTGAGERIEGARQTRTMLAVVTAREHDLAIHRAALKAYDRGGFVRGAVILASGACAVLVAIAVAILG